MLFILLCSKHIPGARFLDLNRYLRPTPLIPRTPPSAADFQHYVRTLGIKKDTNIVLYDRGSSPFLPSCRAWWTFRVSVFICRDTFFHSAYVARAASSVSALALAFTCGHITSKVYLIFQQAAYKQFSDKFNNGDLFRTCMSKI